MPNIMVCMTRQNWTITALHLACAMARSIGAEVTLVKMIPVQHLGWLGSDYGHQSCTQPEFEDLCSYRATAEDYGVELSACPFQYVTLPDAIADAADYLDAQIVFATLPESRIPLWRRLQLWWLRQRLARRQRQLYSLEQPPGSTSVNWTPSILVQASQKHR